MFDYVMFVTDQKKIKGGQFQYFYGTKDEMAELKKNNKKIPSDKIISPEIPGPGFAVFNKENMLFIELLASHLLVKELH